MFDQILLALNNFIQDDLGFASDQKKILESKHKLTLADSLDKGHWTTNLCLVASNLAKQNPKELASRLVPILMQLNGVKEIEIAGPGFINIFLTQEAFLKQTNDINVLPTISKKDEQKIINMQKGIRNKK